MGINKPYRDISELPATIPVFPLEGVLLLPRTHLPLNIFEPRYIQMIDAALASSRLIGMIQPSASHSTIGSILEIESIGCLGRITQIAETGDGRYELVLSGITRFRVGAEEHGGTPFRRFHVSCGEFAADLTASDAQDAINRPKLMEMLGTFSERNGINLDWEAIQGTGNELLVNSLSMTMPFQPREKQALLEAPDLAARAEILVAMSELDMAQQSGTSTRLQ